MLFIVLIAHLLIYTAAYCGQGCRNPGEMGRIYPRNNLTVSHPTICVWSSSASPPIIWLWCASKRRSVLEIGKKNFFFGLHLNSGKKVPFLVKTFFLVFTWIRGKKVFHFWWRSFFFGLYLTCSPEKSLGRGSSPPMLKIGQNWGKIANYLPQCSTKICTTDGGAITGLSPHDRNFLARINSEKFLRSATERTTR